MIILIPNTSCKTDEYTFQHSLIQIVWKEKDAKKAIHKCFYIFVDLFSDLLSKWRNLIFSYQLCFTLVNLSKQLYLPKHLWTYLISWQFCVPSKWLQDCCVTCIFTGETNWTGYWRPKRQIYLERTAGTVHQGSSFLTSASWRWPRCRICRGCFTMSSTVICRKREE